MAAIERDGGQTRLITVAEILSWYAGATPGARLVYCSGPYLPAGPTAEKARELKAAGLVGLHRQGQDYLLVKEAPRKPLAPRAADPGLDEAGESIFAALERCVARGRRAYSNRELAKIAGLATRHQASWRVRRLEELGRIAVATVSGPDGTPWRVVTIGRQRSAPPPEGRGHG